MKQALTSSSFVYASSGRIVLNFSSTCWGVGVPKTHVEHRSRDPWTGRSNEKIPLPAECENSIISSSFSFSCSAILGSFDVLPLAQTINLPLSIHPPFTAGLKSHNSDADPTRDQPSKRRASLSFDLHSFVFSSLCIAPGSRSSWLDGSTAAFLLWAASTNLVGYGPARGTHRGKLLHSRLAAVG